MKHNKMKNDKSIKHVIAGRYMSNTKTRDLVEIIIKVSNNKSNNKIIDISKKKL